MYVRNSLSTYIDLIENNSEYITWIKLNPKLANNDEPIILGSIYLPPESSRFLNEDYFDEFENEISEKCSNYKYVYLIGDTNSRTGQHADYVTSDPHLSSTFGIDADSQAFFDKHILLENLGIPLERCSCDNRSNTNGMRLLEICRNKKPLHSKWTPG